MYLISNNLRHYLPLNPGPHVIRVNLAWYDKEKLIPNLIYLEQEGYEVLLDIPSGRQKPPTNIYTISEVQLLCLEHTNIEYLAISNVEHPDHLKGWNEIDNVRLVPKIETTRGIENIEEIAQMSDIQYVMLDHGDLFLDIQGQKLTCHLYDDYITPFVEKCQQLEIKVLRERGLVFSDE